MVGMAFAHYQSVRSQFATIRHAPPEFFDALCSTQRGKAGNVKLTGALEKRKKEILERWFRAVADTYPPETSRFLRAEKDRFANPVGFAVTKGLSGILECLLADAPQEEIAPHLDEIVRIRAVQSFTPSRSVDCLLAVKGIVREVLAGREEPGEGEFREFDDRVDRLMLIAFDNYMDCRERLFDIKVKELKEMVAIQTRNSWKKSAVSPTNAKERTAEGQS